MKARRLSAGGAAALVEPSGSNSRAVRGNAAYELSVFVNCPFDDDHLPLLHATLFTISDCGFVPRTALEADGTAATRLDRIATLVRECRLSIHDLSRIEPDTATGLPRFNMPFELGLAFGAVFFKRGAPGRKRNLLLMASEPFQDKKYLSDLAGQDGSYHKGRPVDAVLAVRKFLSRNNGERPLRGHTNIAARLARFGLELPEMARALPVPVTADELGTLHYLNEWIALASRWQARTD